MRKKKTVEPEYSLNIFRVKDERLKKKRLVLLVRTIKEFTSFRYEILLQDRLHDNKIELRILGLHAPELLMPGTGPALARREYDDLRGSYELTVTKLDGESNHFSLEFTSRDIAIKPTALHPFILVSTEPVQLS